MNIPKELKKLPQWVNWEMQPDESRPGKMKKLPINPLTGGKAQSNNPTTWTTYQTAIKKSDKLGFMFANGYFGVDIDNAEYDILAYKDGDTNNIIYEFINSLKSYAEYSVSGNGIHIICKGSLPPTGRRKGNVEMYSKGRFFIMTGNIASEYKEIADCTNKIKDLHIKYIQPKPEYERKMENMLPINLSEAEIIKLIESSKQAGAFNKLFSGNYESLYNSASEADMALCSMLAFWCKRDEQMVDSLFRKSNLMREKWDRKQSGSTYGAITVSKACKTCENVYEPKQKYEIYFNQEGEEIKEKKQYTYDDTGNAERLKDLFGENIRYSYTNKCWMFFNGKKWVDDNVGAIKKIADKVAEIMKNETITVDEDMEDKEKQAIKKAFERNVKSVRSNKGKTAMIKECEHLVSITLESIDNNKSLLNIDNGIIDLVTGELCSHDKSKLMTKISNVEYTDTQDCPLWENFLSDIFDGDKELIKYIQKAIGYSLTGSTVEQCAFFMYGTGRNGKSTFLDVVTEIMGDYAVNIQPETIMVKPGGSGNASSDIARLKGARLATCAEPNEGVRLNEGLIKQLTGGDKVTARRLYGHEFEFVPEFKLWMSTNHKPIIRGTDIGIWRRIHLIPFIVSIPEEKVNKNLPLQLKQEYPAILKWAVDGALMWRREGLKIPEAICDATKGYKSEMDVISAWIDECCVLEANSYEKASDLFASYLRWAGENNEYKMSSTKFGREIVKRFNKKTSTYVVYSGLRLKQQPYSINFG